MNISKVEKWTLIYEILKTISKIVQWVYYKEVKITGMDNIPDDKPVLLAPNHQNALMDALAVAVNTKQQAVFLARSDIFANSFFTKLLIMIKIMPVYRIRDGKEKLKLNEQIFQKSVEVLENKKMLVIYPEATHTDRRKLLILQKGLSRVAFQTEEKNNFQMNLQIIPVGIYYNNYYTPDSKLLVNVGKPMTLKKYKEMYREKQNNAFLAFRKDLTEAISDLAIDIPSDEDYQIYEYARDLADAEWLKKNNKPLNATNKFRADKHIIDKLAQKAKAEPQWFDEFKIKLTDYFQKIEQHKLRDYVLEKDYSAFTDLMLTLLAIVTYPVVLATIILHPVQYVLPQIILPKIKDAQFHSSFRFALYYILSMMLYPITFGILALIFNWWIALAVIFAAPFLAKLAFKWGSLWIKVKGFWRWNSLKKTEEGRNMQHKRSKLLSELMKLD